MKLHYPLAQFDVQSVSSNGKLDDIGMFNLVRCRFSAAHISPSAAQSWHKRGVAMEFDTGLIEKLALFVWRSSRANHSSQRSVAYAVSRGINLRVNGWNYRWEAEFGHLSRR